MNLEKMVKEFFYKHTIEEINKEEVTRVFKDINKKGEGKYSLLHVISDYSYDTNKALKFIEILLELGIDPNDKEEYGEYTFIHLAFYSNYPFEFFKQLIPLAINYNFDVNSKYVDGDTILHSAIFSEDYFDKIFPLFEIVGENFDFLAVNYKKQNLLEALKSSLKEAETSKNQNWFNQLQQERNEITNFVSNKLEEQKRLREEQKRIEKEKKEREEYQQFLTNFKEQLKNYKSMGDIDLLLEQSKKIKDIEYQKIVTEQLATVAEQYQHKLQGIEDINKKLENCCTFFSNNELISIMGIEKLMSRKNEIKRLGGIEKIKEVIDIANVESFISLIETDIYSSLNELFENTYSEIYKILLPLNDLSNITDRDLSLEVVETLKTNIKTKKKEKND